MGHHTNSVAFLITYRNDMNNAYSENRLIMPNQVDCVKYFHTAALITAGIRQVAVVVVRGKTADAGRVWRRVTNCVQHLHVTNVVNIQRLLEAHHKSLQKMITSRFQKFSVNIKPNALTNEVYARKQQEQETKLSLTGRAQHHITVLPVEYNSRNNCRHMTSDRACPCGAVGK